LSPNIFHFQNHSLEDWPLGTDAKRPSSSNWHQAQWVYMLLACLTIDFVPKKQQNNYTVL